MSISVTASRRMRGPRAFGVHLRAAQRPHTASLGHIPRHQGTASSSRHRPLMSPRRCGATASARGCLCCTCSEAQESWKDGNVMLLFFFLCLSCLLTGGFCFAPQGETKQCEERLLCFGGRQRAEHDSRWTSAAGRFVFSRKLCFLLKGRRAS